MKPRPPWRELATLCQKPGYRERGTWMARYVARPAALCITWALLPTGISAHAMTILALLVGWGAALALCYGNAEAWLAGALLLQLWYVLDHVDGQLARIHRTDSLDGTALDYLMHHLVHPAIPLGMGVGLFVRLLQPGWLLAGLAAAVGLQAIGLLNDTRYKAFMKRLKQRRGELRVRPCRDNLVQPAGPVPIGAVLARVARKFCEVHVMMNLLTLVALLQWSCGDADLLIGCGYLLALAAVTPVTAVAVLGRSLARGDNEREFDSWFEEISPEPESAAKSQAGKAA